MPVKVKSNAVAPIFSEDLAILNCTAEALPTPLLNWTFGNTYIDGNTKYTITTKFDQIRVTSILKFKVKPGDYGNYFCIVKNVAGTRRIQIPLVQASELISHCDTFSHTLTCCVDLVGKNSTAGNVIYTNRLTSVVVTRCTVLIPGPPLVADTELESFPVVLVVAPAAIVACFIVVVVVILCYNQNRGNLLSLININSLTDTYCVRVV